MRSARSRLTPEIEQSIVRDIRTGCYAWVAAEAAGVPRRLFRDWLRRGARRATQPYRHFYEKVRQALAETRLRAEADAFGNDPRFWLARGPGREQPGSPGWSAPAKARSERKPADVLQSAEWTRLWVLIRQVLSAYPDARVALVQALANQKADKVKG